MAKKQWYVIYGTTPEMKDIELAKVKSEGLAYIVASALAAHYKDVKIK